jgi:hypothetical protein
MADLLKNSGFMDFVRRGVVWWETRGSKVGSGSGSSAVGRGGESGTVARAGGEDPAMGGVDARGGTEFGRDGGEGLPGRHDC